MKAVRYEAPGDFSVTDVPIPPVGPLDVRIRIHQSGVCGTDLHLHHGTYIGVYPLTPGHETIGEIDEVGADVTRFRPGQRVTVNPKHLLRRVCVLPGRSGGPMRQYRGSGC